MNDQAIRVAAFAICVNDRFGQPCRCQEEDRPLIHMRDWIHCQKHIRGAEAVIVAIRGQDNLEATP